MAQITDVLTRLIEHTNAGRVDWKTTSDEQTFIVVYNNLSAMVQEDEFYGNVLKIFDASGKEIERLDSGLGGGDWATELSSLHQMALRAALGVDKQLDEFLKEIESATLDKL